VYYEEKCDTSAGGCLSTCEPDLGWNCTTAYPSMISTCVQKCGNNKNDPDMFEICDDGNNLSGDGCSKGCTVIEAPYVCPLVGKCNMYCGNGFFEGDDPRIGLVGTQNELCDDGNRDSGDGCSKVCEIEPGWTCVNKFIGLILEKPGYRSFCVRSGSGIGDMGSADNKALYQMSQVEEYSWDKYTARGSTSGKFRLIEYQGQRGGTKVELQGVTFVTRANQIF
jgi:cysteine-rich repeat protein